MTNSVPQSSIRPGAIRSCSRGAATKGRALNVDPNVASAGYFETLGVPVPSGRTLRDSDSLDPTPVAVIDQSMAAFWNGAYPVGRASRWTAGRATPHGDHGRRDCRRLPALRRGHGDSGAVRRAVQSERVRRPDHGADGGSTPSELAKTIRTAVQTTNAQTPVEELQTLDELRNGRLAVPGLTAALLSIFAAIALVMTVAGLAGLIGTSVSQRTREFGLRMALGASRGSVLKLVLSQGVVLVVIGLALGIVGAYAFSQLITGFLFETTATNVMGTPRRRCCSSSPPRRRTRSSASGDVGRSTDSVKGD